MKTMQFNLSKKTWDPHPFQETGIRILITQACAGILMDPGLGKTATVLAAYKILKKKKLVKSMLVIAPLRVCYSVWPKEIEKWTNFEGLTVSIIHGGKDKRLQAMKEKADIYLINPEGVSWFFEHGGVKRIGADVLCVDESTKFKNSQTARFKHLRKELNSFRRRWILTGTPAPNGLHDLFGQIYILDQGAALGAYVTHFRNRYFIPDYSGYGWRPVKGAGKKIQKAIDPLVVRFKSEDWLELPELMVRDVEVDLPPNARKLYKELADEFYTELEDLEVTALNAAAKGMKLRQILNGALYGEPLPHRPSVRKVHEVHTAKIEALKDLIEELQGQPALVIYEFEHDRKRICEALKAPAIGGGTTPKKSADYIKQFSLGALPVLVGHPASMGHGIDGLQDSCHHIIFYGITWDFELYEQTIRRVWRQGNKNNRVVIHRLIVRNSIDEEVCLALESKENVQKSFLKLLRDQKTVAQEG